MTTVTSPKYGHATREQHHHWPNMTRTSQAHWEFINSQHGQYPLTSRWDQRSCVVWLCNGMSEAWPDQPSSYMTSLMACKLLLINLKDELQSNDSITGLLWALLLIGWQHSTNTAPSNDDRTHWIESSSQPTDLHQGLSFQPGTYWQYSIFSSQSSLLT